MAVPQINTYHCLCTSLLLATTHQLSSLPRRTSPSLDSAIIVPLPVVPEPPKTLSRPSSASADGEGDSDGLQAATKSEAKLGELGYTVLLSTTLDRHPTLIRRSDGFERRYLVRCGRCRLVVGYELDPEHYATSIGTGTTGGSEALTAMDVDINEKGEERMKIVYLLPGGVMKTEVMVSGKKIEEKDVMLGEGLSTAVIAAWE